MIFISVHSQNRDHRKVDMMVNPKDYGFHSTYISPILFLLYPILGMSLARIQMGWWNLQ